MKIKELEKILADVETDANHKAKMTEMDAKHEARMAKLRAERETIEAEFASLRERTNRAQTMEELESVYTDYMMTTKELIKKKRD